MQKKPTKNKKKKRAHAFKNYTHSYNIKTLNSFNLELQLKNTEFSVKNKLKKILSELRSF